MKIYVITKGCYSDYHIVAVATDPEKADRMAEFFSTKYESAEVEEYDTDDVPDNTEGKRCYHIQFGAGGNVIYIDDMIPESWNDEPFSYAHTPEHVHVSVIAESKEAAIKIGAEKRAQFLAEKMGL